MSGISGAFGAVFGLVGLLFAAGGATMAVVQVRRVRAIGHTRAHGLTAEARCLETYVTQYRDSEGHRRTRRHVILGFRTRDGQDVRVEDQSGVPRVVGDFVPVHYLPDRPQQAVAAGPVAPGVQLATWFGVAFCTVFACLGLFFAGIGFGIGSLDLGPSPDPAAPTDFFPEPVTFP
ncbi:DUF3592 domain-containing protein [Streptomyces sp. NPDC089919]|uniref:DUF3592 domain-containing protein n=1 Tax=Streptomyces sp. NPDC089919 TaxID=3155188 RepID=UPI0034235304